MEALADVGYTWQTWGGVWGGDRDPVHFEYPGFSPPPPDAPSEEAGSRIAHFISNWFLTIGPWWSPMTAENLLKTAVKVEKALGFEAALSWFYNHAGKCEGNCG
jgi:hypothetical protein